MAFVQPSDPDVGDATKASLPVAQNLALADLDSRVSGVASSLLSNGSFEIDDGGAPAEPVSWDIIDASGGSHSLDITTVHHGEQSLKCTTDASDGRVEALSADFIPIAEGEKVRVLAYLNASTGSIRTRFHVLFYNKAESLISTGESFEDTSTRTSWGLDIGIVLTAPADSAFFKVKILVAEAGDSVVGDVYVDGVSVEIAQGLLRLYESAWTSINNGGDNDFAHGLGHTPVFISVLLNPTAGNYTEARHLSRGDGDTHITSVDSTNISIDNDSGGTLYFKVFAF